MAAAGTDSELIKAFISVPNTKAWNFQVVNVGGTLENIAVLHTVRSPSELSLDHHALEEAEARIEAARTVPDRATEDPWPVFTAADSTDDADRLLNHFKSLVQYFGNKSTPLVRIFLLIDIRDNNRCVGVGAVNAPRGVLSFGKPFAGDEGDEGDETPYTIYHNREVDDELRVTWFVDDDVGFGVAMVQRSIAADAWSVDFAQRAVRLAEIIAAPGADRASKAVARALEVAKQAKRDDREDEHRRLLHARRAEAEASASLVTTAGPVVGTGSGQRLRLLSGRAPPVRDLGTVATADDGDTHAVFEQLPMPHFGVDVETPPPPSPPPAVPTTDPESDPEAETTATEAPAPAPKQRKKRPPLPPAGGGAGGHSQRRRVASLPAAKPMPKPRPTPLPAVPTTDPESGPEAETTEAPAPAPKQRKKRPPLPPAKGGAGGHSQRHAVSLPAAKPRPMPTPLTFKTYDFDTGFAQASRYLSGATIEVDEETGMLHFTPPTKNKFGPITVDTRWILAFRVLEASEECTSRTEGNLLVERIGQTLGAAWFLRTPGAPEAARLWEDARADKRFPVVLGLVTISTISVVGELRTLAAQHGRSPLVVPATAKRLVRGLGGVATAGK